MNGSCDSKMDFFLKITYYFSLPKLVGGKTASNYRLVASRPVTSPRLHFSREVNTSCSGTRGNQAAHSVVRLRLGPAAVYLWVGSHVSWPVFANRPDPGSTTPVCFEECRKGESSRGMFARKKKQKKKRWGENSIAVLPGSETVDSNKVTACK